jgi:hypothetical protein
MPAKPASVVACKGLSNLIGALFDADPPWPLLRGLSSRSAEPKLISD